MIFIKNKKVFLEIICAFFIFLFVYASVTKLIDYTEFKIQISKSPLLAAFTNYIAWGIPTIELIIAFMIAIPYLRLIGLYFFFRINGNVYYLHYCYLGIQFIYPLFMWWDFTKFGLV